jgi:hypothetical protein
MLRSFIQWLYRQFRRRPFRTKQVLQRMEYMLYPVSRSAIYVAMHKCWKMGLLSREHFYGHSYMYCISNWGVRYVEEGYQYRESEVRIKLLNYILQYGDKSEKQWAEEVLVPRLLQRFFPGRRAQHIEPYVDLPEALLHSAEVLEQRIHSEAFEPDEEFVIECYYDLLILYNVIWLLQQLYGTYDPIITSAELERRMTEVIDDILFYEPPHRIIIRGFGPSGKTRARLRLKPRSEHRPNDTDCQKLMDLYHRLRELTSTVDKTSPP